MSVRMGIVGCSFCCAALAGLSLANMVWGPGGQTLAYIV